MRIVRPRLAGPAPPQLAQQRRRNQPVAQSLTGIALALLLLALAAPSARAATANDSAVTANPVNESFYAPRRHQFDLELYNMSDFVTDDSLIRRRQGSTAGSALHWGPDLGASTIQEPGIKGSFWFDDSNALQFQFRYFALYGSHFLSSPVTFNGDVIAPGQNISASDSTWFTFGLFYERRITPWLARYTGDLPALLQGWDLRPRIGLEFVYLDFKINNGRPALLRGSLDARGRWHDQELPIPTLGITGRHWLGDQLALEVSAQGNWINKWNSLRTQGGTVYLSQASFETHWRLFYVDPQLIGLRPFLGIAYYYYKQSETSGAIGNMARLQAFGPEVGINYSFGF